GGVALPLRGNGRINRCSHRRKRTNSLQRGEEGQADAHNDDRAKPSPRSLQDRNNPFLWA
ncbi:MAG: hypothetical protein OEV17_04415, partial [Nitrospira sp.]|nr:hypothetical protein [Nitrospira sp.]